MSIFVACGGCAATIAVGHYLNMRNLDEADQLFAAGKKNEAVEKCQRVYAVADAHSKKWENHEAALGLFLAFYGFCRKHMTLKTTPARAAGLATEAWSLARCQRTHYFCSA